MVVPRSRVLPVEPEPTGMGVPEPVQESFTLHIWSDSPVGLPARPGRRQWPRTRQMGSARNRRFPAGTSHWATFPAVS